MYTILNVNQKDPHSKFNKLLGRCQCPIEIRNQHTKQTIDFKNFISTFDIDSTNQDDALISFKLETYQYSHILVKFILKKSLNLYENAKDFKQVDFYKCEAY